MSTRLSGAVPNGRDLSQNAIQQRFATALDTLVEQVKSDRSILAAILCGSLSHDTVWARSDIDLVLVTVDDKKLDVVDVALSADGVNVHAMLMSRHDFRQTVEGSQGNSFMHSFLSKGRLLYTHDATIADLFSRLHHLGDRDRQLQLLRTMTAALPAIDKAHKWFITRGDLNYTALWILYAATPLARAEVIGRGLIADREVLPQAMQLNPDFFATIYTQLLNTRKSTANVRSALDAIDRYVADRAPELFALVIDYLCEVGEARSCTEIEAHFKKTFDVSGVITTCEYLAAEGLIGKAATPVRLTKRSNIHLQELAFFYLEPESRGR